MTEEKNKKSIETILSLNSFEFPHTASTTHRLNHLPPQPLTATTTHRHNHSPPQPLTASTTHRHNHSPPQPLTASTTHRLNHSPPQPLTASTTHRLNHSPPQPLTASTTHRLNHSPPQPHSASTTHRLNHSPPQPHSAGEPGSQLVDERFRLDLTSFMTSSEGVVVASFDGRGAGGRGVRNVHEVYKQLGALDLDDLLRGIEWVGGGGGSG